MPYSPLGRGFLTGTIRSANDLIEGDRRHEHPRFQAENLRRNTALLGQLDEMAQAKGATVAQIALAWVLARGEDVVPIPGTKRRAWLEQNLAALEVTLSPDEVMLLDDAFPPDSAAGTRYPEAQLARLEI